LCGAIWKMPAASHSAAEAEIISRRLMAPSARNSGVSTSTTAYIDKILL
jgi:hypothetical protein